MRDLLSNKCCLANIQLLFIIGSCKGFYMAAIVTDVYGDLRIVYSLTSLGKCISMCQIQIRTHSEKPVLPAVRTIYISFTLGIFLRFFSHFSSLPNQNFVIFQQQAVPLRRGEIKLK